MRRSDRIALVSLAVVVAVALAVWWALPGRHAGAGAAVAPPGVAVVAAGGAPPRRAAGEAWQRLTPAQRADRRGRYAAFMALPPDERQRLRQAQDAFRALPPAQQQALRRRFAALDTLQQRGWRLGPALGGDYPRLHGLIGFVPESQRDRLLATLRGMSIEQRRQLAILAQRTPPQERDVLRRSLLATPAAQRDAWLRQRLQD